MRLIKRMNILFICKHNRFRSKVAEALFKKYNKNTNVRAYSAGLIIGGTGHRHIAQAARHFGITITSKQQSITKELLDAMDIIVDVADDVPSTIFKQYLTPRKKLLVWNIEDFTGEGIEPRKKIMIKILSRVQKLISEVSKK